MNIYHIYIKRGGTERWIALGLYSESQAQLVGSAFPEVTRIETWDGHEVYRKRTVH